MSRKVYISSTMAHDESLARAGEINPLFPLLWPWFLAAADDWGRGKASAYEIRSMVFAANELVTVAVIEDALATYNTLGMLTLYEVEGKRYFQINQDYWGQLQSHLMSKLRRKPHEVTPRLRREILERDRYTCQYCGATSNLQIDHIVPIARGGTADPINLQVLCQPCNRTKGVRV